MDWFERVFGFREEGGYDAVQSKFNISQDVSGNVILKTVTSAATESRQFQVGKFETPTLHELRSRLAQEQQPSSCSSSSTKEGITFHHIQANVADLHHMPHNQGAVFQAASQFNCLEMVSPSITPERGITRYQNDHTQGPACAMACPAGTLYRNYFATRGNDGQIDNLQDVGRVLGNYPENTANNNTTTTKPKYWKMKNGYALPATRTSIRELSQKLLNNTPLQQEAMKHLRVGVHWNTEVDRVGEEGLSVDQPLHTVTQVYCSALPLAYDQTASNNDWEAFARLILEGAYKSTLTVANLLAQERQERVLVYWTMLGGGAFGNPAEWIRDAMQQALHENKDAPLDVYLVHYGQVDDAYIPLSAN